LNRLLGPGKEVGTGNGIFLTLLITKKKDQFTLIKIGSFYIILSPIYVCLSKKVLESQGKLRPKQPFGREMKGPKDSKNGIEISMLLAYSDPSKAFLIEPFGGSPMTEKSASTDALERRVKDLEEEAIKRRRAEEDLRKSERRYRKLLEFLPHPVVLFTPDGRVSYLNAAFTEKFGWSLEELKGRKIPYVPPDLQQETDENIKRLFQENALPYQETKRLTKDGRVIDVAMKAALYYEREQEPSGELVILRDITREKRIASQNEATLRISTALPEYPDLGELLEYINSEVKRLLNTEGAVVVLRDEERDEIFILGASYDDAATQKRIKEIRFTCSFR
jgi:PAS domain S-box-containing protein